MAGIRRQASAGLSLARTRSSVGKSQRESLRDLHSVDGFPEVLRAREQRESCVRGERKRERRKGKQRHRSDNACSAFFRG